MEGHFRHLQPLPRLNYCYPLYRDLFIRTCFQAVIFRAGFSTPHLGSPGQVVIMQVCEGRHLSGGTSPRALCEGTRCPGNTTKATRKTCFKLKIIPLWSVITPLQSATTFIWRHCACHISRHISCLARQACVFKSSF
ncbi:hypothetical protein E2C01_071093 [Portunus trituberculatus]|uniref:Uncharacterized protein n=1 Tax=Portunus trituberculatus TaxID=210409 RepID=A0A5B7I4B4_PORTR|nr:hypothetical protein [Portunus trituberculatus]